MRRSGYLVAALVLALAAALFWFVLFSDGWVARTGWEPGDDIPALD